MLEEDQAEVMAASDVENRKKSQKEQDALRAELHEKCMARVERVLEILETIKVPSISNIGAEGSEAISVLALHSNLATLKRILGLFEKLYNTDPDDVRIESMPSMKDRVSILEARKQIFGTNWFMDENDRPYLITFEDFPGVNERRAAYNLEPVMRPRNLSPCAVEYPLGKGPALETDQKEMTDQEFTEYSEYYI